MKVVVDGVIYDTGDAEICGTYIPQEVRLYRRLDDGTFFLLSFRRQMYRSLGDQGKAIKIAESTETMLTPLSDTDARLWAETHLPSEAACSLF